MTLFAAGMLLLPFRPALLLLGAIVCAYALLGHRVVQALLDRGMLTWYTHLIERILERSPPYGLHPEVSGITTPARFLVWDKVVRRLCPVYKNSVRFLCMRVNDLLYSLPYFRHWGYRNWENGLYTADNLRAYDGVLQRLQASLTRRGVGFFFVTLPNVYHASFAEKYEHVFVLLRRNGIPYLDLLPEIRRRFGTYSAERIRRELWASPVNSHPGKTMTHLYADLVQDYLESQRLLPAALANGEPPTASPPMVRPRPPEAGAGRGPEKPK